MSDTGGLAHRAAELRGEFDRSFASPRGLEREQGIDLLAFSVAGTPYAVRLAEVVRLLADRRIVAVASPDPAFLGLVGVRAGVLPVYCLSELLGQGRVPRPRWVLVAGPGARVGLAFDQYDGHLALAPREVAAAAGAAAAVPYVAEVTIAGGASRPILSLAALVEAITRRAGVGRPQKER